MTSNRTVDAQQLRQWTAEWQASSNLQAEFATSNAYINNRMVHRVRPSTQKTRSVPEQVSTHAAAQASPAGTLLPTSHASPVSHQQDTHMTPVSENVRLAGLEGLLTNIAGHDNRKEAEAIVSAAKVSGASISATALALLSAGVCATTEDQFRGVYSQSAALQREFATAGHYVAYRNADLRRAGAKGSSTAVTGGGNVQSWTAEFDGSAELQAEFGSIESYIALRRHETRRRR